MNVFRPFHWFIVTVLLFVYRVNCQTPDDKSDSGALYHNNAPQPSSTLFGAILTLDANNDHRQPVNRTAVNVRKRRFVRFPSGPNGYVETVGGPPVGPLSRSNMARYNPQVGGYYSPWRQQKSYWRSAASAGDFQRPSAVMGHRTPRLIFRDNDFPPTNPLPPSNFFQSNNHLSDFDDEFKGKLIPFFFLIIYEHVYCESYYFLFMLHSRFNKICLSIKFITLQRLSILIINYGLMHCFVAHFSLCTKKKANTQCFFFFKYNEQQ